MKNKNKALMWWRSKVHTKLIFIPTLQSAEYMLFQSPKQSTFGAILLNMIMIVIIRMSMMIRDHS